MNFALIPAYGEETASSRIRVYTLQQALAQKGIHAVIGDRRDADVLLVQKIVTLKTLRAANQARARGAIVIYDIDDVGPALLGLMPRYLFNRMLETASIVTTDTAGHRDQLIGEMGISHVAIIPDAIDYNPKGPVQLPLTEGNPLRLLWFGNISNVALFERYVASLVSLPNTQVVAATQASAVTEYAIRFPEVSFVPWTQDGFISILQSCHLSCLMHDGTDIDRAKSNNKLIASITWGVPAVVSATPEYERTAREAGVENSVFRNSRDLVEAIERLRPLQAREEYLRKAQPDIWAKYSPAAVADVFVDLVKSISREKPAQILPKRAFPAHIPEPLASSAAVLGDVALERTRLVRIMLDRLRNRGLRYCARAAFARVPGLRRFTVPKPRTRDYERDWVNPEGREYRMAVYHRQRQGGDRPLVSNPSADEVRQALLAHSPRQVLEVGCGWGRLLEEIAGEFNIQGCDISDDYLALVPKHIKVFKHDIALEDQQYYRANADAWDVLFTRGLMLYFMDHPEQMAQVMNNMMSLAAKKIIIWEWPEVCKKMQQVCASDKFEYHPIEHRDE